MTGENDLQEVNFPKVTGLADDEYVRAVTKSGDSVQIKKSDLLLNIQIGDSRVIGYPCCALGLSTWHDAGAIKVKMVLFCFADVIGITCGRLFSCAVDGFNVMPTYADIYITVHYTGTPRYIYISRINENIKIGTCIYKGVRYLCGYIIGSINDYRGVNLYFTGSSTYLKAVPFNECTDFTEGSYLT